MIIKRLLQLFIALVLIAVLAAVGLVLFVDPNNYKDTIVEKVEIKLDRDFAIEGDISWRFWPRLGMSIDGVALGQPQGFDSNKPFAQVGEASIFIALTPLFHKSIEVDSLRVSDAHFNLIKRSDGVTNWDDLLVLANEPAADDATQTAETTQAVDESMAASDADSGFELEVSELRIENANVTWDDQSSGQTYQLTGFTLHTALRAAQHNPFDLTFQVDLQPEDIQLAVKAGGDYYFNLEAQQYESENFDITVVAQGIAGTQDQQEIRLKFNKLLADIAQDQLMIDDLEVNALGGRVFIDASVDNFSQAPQVQGKLTTDNLNLREIAQALGHTLDTQNDKALSRVDIDATFSAQENGFSMQPFHARLDDTQLAGSLNVATINEQAAIKFNLDIDRLNLDGYLPAEPAEQTPATATQTSTQSARAGGESAADLGDLRFDGDLSIGDLTVSGMHLTDVNVSLDIDNGVIRLNPFSANFYQGAINTQGTLNTQGAVPAWDVNVKLDGVDLGALLKDAADNEQFTGRLNFDAALTTQGDAQDSLMRNLNGHAQFNVENGVLHGTDLAYLWSVGQGMLSEGLQGNIAGVFESKPNTGQTEFEQMSGRFNISNGVASNDDLVLYNPGFYGAGKGKLDLPQDRIDYVLRLSGAKQTDAGIQPEGTAIPIKISGSLSDPDFGVDAALIQELIVQSIGGTVTDTLKQALPIFGAGAAAVEEGAEESGEEAASGVEEGTDETLDVLEDPAKAIGDRLRKMF